MNCKNEAFEDNRLFLEKLAKGISKHFGENCEIAVHDLKEDEEATIKIIENGYVTNRKVGDSISEIGLKILSEKSTTSDKIGYLARTKDGRLLKCSSLVIRDQNKDPYALFCINYDITTMSMASSSINEFIKIETNVNTEEVDTIVDNVNDLLDLLLEESCKHVGKPVCAMTKEEKVDGIKYLNEKGAFLIKKSSDKVSSYYDISKYTLYNYLGEC